MLTIILVAAQPGDGSSAASLAPLQVLPLDDGERGWPRLIGRVLRSFFSGDKAPIKALSLDAGHDQIPDDVLEGWATVFWAAQAASNALKGKTFRNSAIPGMFEKNVVSAYARTALRIDELTQGIIPSIIKLMSERFAQRIQISADDILKAHEGYARRATTAATPPTRR